VPVGIVVVSHSAALAAAVAELATEMAGDDLRLALAGGVDDDEAPLGTDAVKVMAAIEEVDDEAGVLVLMDLGSAVLSAEMALDLLPPETAARVVLCEAPIVEGLIAAAVQASGRCLHGGGGRRGPARAGCQGQPPRCRRRSGATEDGAGGGG
jgi:dihydroxyacetone kinase phosphotransfer subunit